MDPSIIDESETKCCSQHPAVTAAAAEAVAKQRYKVKSCGAAF